MARRRQYPSRIRPLAFYSLHFRETCQSQIRYWENCLRSIEQTLEQETITFKNYAKVKKYVKKKQQHFFLTICSSNVSGNQKSGGR